MWGAPPTNPTPRRSRRRRAGIIIAVVAVVLLVVGGLIAAGVAVVEDFAAGFDDGWIGEPTAFGPEGSERAFGLSVGDCTLGEDGELSWGADDVVPCGAEHRAEHYATLPVPDVAGDAYPGRAELESYAYGGCEVAFMPYVGARYLDSEYDYAVVVPNTSAWDAGAREVHCLLIDGWEATVTTGSGRGSGR